MDTKKSTDTVTVIPADLYDELAIETPPEPNAKLRAAAERAREVIIHRRHKNPASAEQ